MPKAPPDGIPQSLSTLSELLAYDDQVPIAAFPPLKAAAEIVKELRASFGVDEKGEPTTTQEKFAEMLGVNRTMVAKWETGVDQPSWPKMWKVLNLRDGEGKTWLERRATAVQASPMTATETRLLEEFRRLADRDQIDVLVQVIDLARRQPFAAPSKG